jgi:D-alanyl-D-alanine dipeptidase
MLLPDWMALMHISVADNFCKLRDEIKRRGGILLISDMFRPWDVQEKAHKEKPDLALDPRKGSYHMAGLAFDCLINEKYLTMKLTEFREFIKDYGFTGIRKENWHYQAIKLPDGYKNLIEVIKALGNWRG